MGSHLIPKSATVIVETNGGGTANSGKAVENKFISLGPISSHHVVQASVIGVSVASSLNSEHANRLLGVTKTSASGIGEEVTYISSGLLQDPSFTFTPGPVYLGPTGNLVQIKPTTGLLVQVGVAFTPIDLLVEFSLIINLG